MCIWVTTPHLIPLHFPEALLHKPVGHQLGQKEQVVVMVAEGLPVRVMREKIKVILGEVIRMHGLHLITLGAMAAKEANQVILQRM
jgi:hypothetical protein